MHRNELCVSAVFFFIISTLNLMNLECEYFETSCKCIFLINESSFA